MVSVHATNAAANNNAIRVFVCILVPFFMIKASQLMAGDTITLAHAFMCRLDLNQSVPCHDRQDWNMR